MTKKRYVAGIISAIVIIVATLVILLPDKQDDELKSKNIDLYYFNDTYTSIVAENRDIKYESSRDLPELVLEALMSGPSDSKNKAIFPENTHLLSFDERFGDVVIDFSKEYMSEENSKGYLATYAIVKSLCQVGGVDRVMVTVEGEEIIASDGTMIGYLSDDDIDLVSDTTTQDSKTLMLFFADKDEDILRKEQRVIKITDTMPVEQYIVNELIKGTQSEKLRNIISTDTELISAQTTDGTCFVNFKSGFVEKNTGNGKNEELIIYSIVNSLCEIDGVNSVQFLVDGKKIESFGNIDISKFFECNEELGGNK